MKHYVNSEGKYLGGWDDNPPIGAIEVPDAPDDARKLWGFPGWSDPAPTYQQRVAEINAAYQADVEGFNRAYALAGLSDGATQETKQATIRAQFIARRTQYISDLAAARTEYEV